jgi:hypothetical protein
VTATLSVEAVHVRLIAVVEAAVPARFVGTEGGVVSPEPPEMYSYAPMSHAAPCGRVVPALSVVK